MSKEKNTIQFLLRFILLGMPTLAVLITAFLVLLGDEGILESSRAEEQLASIRIQTEQIRSSNHDLEVQIRRLRSSPQQVELLTAEELQKASSDVTIYRFYD